MSGAEEIPTTQASVSSEAVIPRFHANAVSVGGGPFDVALDFGYRPTGDKPDAEWQVRVTMSWEHLSSLVPLLQKLVDQYESEVGPLPNVRRLDQAASHSD